MDALIRWERLLEKIRPYDPKAGKGRAPYELESMLRVHCVQLFYNLSDPATEDMLYEIERVRRFTGISLKKVPDETQNSCSTERKPVSGEMQGMVEWRSVRPMRIAKWHGTLP